MSDRQQTTTNGRLDLLAIAGELAYDALMEFFSTRTYSDAIMPSEETFSLLRHLAAAGCTVRTTGHE